MESGTCQDSGSTLATTRNLISLGRRLEHEMKRRSEQVIALKSFRTFYDRYEVTVRETPSAPV